MIGTIRWNIATGAVCFIFTFIRSISGNLLLSSFIHSLISGTIIFGVTFVFRWLLGTIINPTDAEDSPIGNQVNLTTPDEEAEIHQWIRQDQEQGTNSASFEPLNLPKLASKPNADPEEMAKALRHMSED